MPRETVTAKRAPDRSTCVQILSEAQRKTSLLDVKVRFFTQTLAGQKRKGVRAYTSRRISEDRSVKPSRAS